MGSTTKSPKLDAASTMTGRRFDAFRSVNG
jgi:hypothetical protein